MKKIKTSRDSVQLLTRKTKLRVNAETIRALTDNQLQNVGAGNSHGSNNTAWCSVGAFVGGCR